MHYELHNFAHFFVIFYVQPFIADSGRVPAWHPLANLSGCLGTRSTRLTTSLHMPDQRNATSLGCPQITDEKETLLVQTLYPKDTCNSWI